MQTFDGGGGEGLEDGIAMIFSPSYLLCTIKGQMGEGGNGVGSFEHWRQAYN